MKTLLILRHAKSSWDDTDLSDFERPLNARGLTAAPLMGKVMREKHITPDLIISSPAQRARQTTNLLRKTAEFDVPVNYEEKVYEASPLTLLHIAAGIDAEKETVLFIGHNPGLEGFIKVLTGENESMPTAALAKINLNIENWREISTGCGTLAFLIRPKDITGNSAED